MYPLLCTHLIAPPLSLYSWAVAMASAELADDFFYDLAEFERETPTSELPSSFAAPYHSFAFESAKRANLHYLDDGATLLYAAGDPPATPAQTHTHVRARAPRRPSSRTA